VSFRHRPNEPTADLRDAPQDIKPPPYRVAGVDAEVAPWTGDVALDAETLDEVALLHQVGAVNEEVRFAINKCEQACPLSVILQ
jgi:hypothetical protein